MQLHSAVFFSVQAAACIYAARRGGMPERLTAAAMAAAAVATASIPTNPLTSFRSLESLGLTIDVILLAAFAFLMCRADRFWPIWVAALQLLTVMAHLIAATDPHVLPIVYSGFVSWSAYPIIVLFVLGVRRHQVRTRLRPERDWSPIKW